MFKQSGSRQGQRYQPLQRIPRSLVIVSYGLLIVAVAWHAIGEYRSFRATHIALMENSTSMAAAEIASYLGHVRSSINMFVDSEAESIEQLTGNPADPPKAVSQRKFFNKIIRHFPDAIGYSLLDAAGGVRVDYFGDGRRELSVVERQSAKPVDAQTPLKMYHDGVDDYFSIYATHSQADGQHQYALGVGFQPEILQPILAYHQHADHQLILWRHNIPGFVELQPEDINLSLHREFYLEQDDMQRVGAFSQVSGTEWDVVAMHAPALFTTKRDHLIRNGLLQFVIAGTALLVLVYLVNYQMRRRYQLAEEWMTREERLRLALASTEDGVWDFSLTNDSASFDHQWLRIFGLTPEVPLNNIEDWIARVHPDDAAQTREEITNLLRGASSSLELEHRMQAADGSWIWVLDRGRLMGEGRDGKAARLIGTTSDISARKQVELSIRSNETALSNFYSVISSRDQGLQDQLQMLLQDGCRHLGMKCGIISYVEGNRYTVLNVHTESSEYNIKVGDVFDFDITYCQFTLQQRAPVGFAHAAESDIARHPSYRTLKLEAYLGAPIMLDDNPHGTLNFTSIEPRETEFTASEKYYVGLMADWISSQLQQERTEKYRQDIDRKLALHVDYSPLATIEWSSDLVVQKWSQRAEQMLGWSAQQVVGVPIDQWPINDSADRLVLNQLIESLSRPAHEVNMFVLDIPAATGNILHTEWFVIKVLDAQGGREVGLQSVVLDVSKRVRAEQELIQSQAKLADLYDNAPDLYFSISRTGNIMSANKESHDSLGYEPGALIGTPYWNLIEPEDVRRLKRHIDVVFNDSIDEFEIEIRVRKLDGEVINTHQKLRLISPHRNMPQELRIICRDITERARTQKSRLHHMETQRDEISREVQHRVKNSLQAVVGLLKINLDTYPELKDVLVTSIGQVDTIAIVNNLMMDSNNQNVNLYSLLQNIMRGSASLFSKSASTETPDEKLIGVQLWEKETIAISLVLSELVINAMKHGVKAAESGTADVKAKIEFAADNAVRISVINRIADASQTAFIEDRTLWSGAGLAMMESLLPPQGARLLFEVHGNELESGLELSTPVITLGQSISIAAVV